MGLLEPNDSFQDRGLIKITDGTRVIGAGQQDQADSMSVTLAKDHYDEITRALCVVDYAHCEIHSGGSFTCHYTQTVSDIGDRSIIAFKTGPTKFLHIITAASATAAATAIITEAPTITDNEGTTLAVYNRRRIGTPPPTTVIDTSQTPDAAGSAMYFSEIDMGEVTSGTVLATVPIGASGIGVTKAIGGTARATQEWLLKPNTLYAFEVISLTNDENVHWIELDFYEHTDKSDA